MRARVIQQFSGRRDDRTIVETIEPDEIVEGDLAAVAVREGWAVEIDEDGNAILDDAGKKAKAAAVKAAKAAVKTASDALEVAKATQAKAADADKAAADKAVTDAEVALKSAQDELANLG